MKVWECPFIPSHLTFKSFKYHSLLVNQSHNNQTIIQIYLFNITFQNLEFWDVTNCYSIYMNKTFNGLAPEINGLLNPDRSDTHFHAKRYRIVMIVPPTYGTAT